MITTFYFFLKNAIDDSPRKMPYCTSTFMGDIGDFVTIDGVGYYITDFAIEKHSWEELL